MHFNKCILFLCHYSLKSKLFYGISDKLQVGEVTNMYDIAEQMTKADRIIKP